MNHVAHHLESDYDRPDPERGNVVEEAPEGQNEINAITGRIPVS